MLLRGDETYGELHVLPGMALTRDHVPTAVKFIAPWGEEIVLPLSAEEQNEMKAEGAVPLPPPAEGHSHNLLLRLHP